MFCCHYQNSRYTDYVFRPAAYFLLFTDNLTSINVFQNSNLKDPASIYRPTRTTTLDFENPQYCEKYFNFNEFGFANIWNNLYDIKISPFISEFKQRVIDAFIQKWYSELETNQVLNNLYKHIKTDFCLEHYLEIVTVYARIFVKLEYQPIT